MSKGILKNAKHVPAEKLIAGIDIGKKFSWCCGINRGCEKLSGAFRFRCNREGFEKLLDRLRRLIEKLGLNDLVVGMEPSGPYWITLAQYLESNGIEVLLVNPYHVKRSKELFDNSPRKSDKKDALLIARMIDEGKFLRRAELTEELENIRHLMNDLEHYVERKTAVTNRVRSLIAEYFPEFEDVFSGIALKSTIELLFNYPLPCDIIEAGEEKVAELLRKASNGRLGSAEALLLLEKAQKSVGYGRALEQARNSFRRNIEELKHILKEIKALEEDIESLFPTVPGYEYLKSIPDVGAATVCSLLCATGDLRNFSSSGEVLKMIGMNVCEFSSGKWQGKRRISKRGDPKSRRYLYLAAVRSSRKNGIYRDKYCKMKTRGKESPVAFIAIASDLVRIMFSLVRDERTFRRDYSPGRLRKGNNGQQPGESNTGEPPGNEGNLQKIVRDCAPHLRRKCDGRCKPCGDNSVGSSGKNFRKPESDAGSARQVQERAGRQGTRKPLNEVKLP